MLTLQKSTACRLRLQDCQNQARQLLFRKRLTGEVCAQSISVDINCSYDSKNCSTILHQMYVLAEDIDKGRIYPAVELMSRQTPTLVLVFICSFQRVKMGKMARKMWVKADIASVLFGQQTHVEIPSRSSLRSSRRTAIQVHQPKHCFRWNTFTRYSRIPYALQRCTFGIGDD